MILLEQKYNHLKPYNQTQEEREKKTQHTYPPTTVLQSTQL